MENGPRSRPGHESQSDVNRVSSSTPFMSDLECLNCSKLLANVENLDLELDSLRIKIVNQSNAIETLAGSTVNRLLGFALRDFKRIAENSEESLLLKSEEASSSIHSTSNPAEFECSSCQALTRHEQILLSEFQCIKKKIVERTAALETLAAINDDDLLGILIDQFNKIAAGITHIPATSVDLNTSNNVQRRRSHDDEVSATPTKKKVWCDSRIELSPLKNTPVPSTVLTFQSSSLGPNERQQQQQTLSSSQSPDTSGINDVEPDTSDLKPDLPMTTISGVKISFASTSIVEQTDKSNGSSHSNIPLDKEIVVKIEASDDDCDSLMDIGCEYNAVSFKGPPIIMDDQVQLPSSSSQVNENEEMLPHLEEGAQAIALATPKILQKIIKALDFLPLRTSRMVSRQWKKIASSIILKRDICTIVLQYDSELKNFRQSSWLEWDHQHSRGRQKIPSSYHQLPSLNQILYKSNDFPCTSFALSRGNLAHPDVNCFFHIQGKKILELHLKGDSKKLTSMHTLYKILQTKTPKVKYLNIVNFDYGPLKQPRFSQRLNLPALTTLSITLCGKTGQEILDGAINLEELSDPNGDYKSLVQSRRTNLITKIHANENVNNGPLVLFADSSPQPKLDQLLISAQRKFINFSTKKKSQLIVTFSKLLKSSQDSLEHLCLSGLLPCDELLFPRQLTELRLLELDWFPCPLATPCLPASLNLAATFPNLKQLDCGSLHCQDDEGWEGHFPPGSCRGNLPTVTTLSIPDKCSQGWMIKLHDLCPNFTKLNVWGDWDLHVVLPKIFQSWTHLVSIELKVFPLTGTLGKQMMFNLDPALCGFSWDMCLPAGSSSSAEKMEDGAVGPSICDLKELQYLKIAFSCCHLELSKAFKNSSPISSVSGKAFKRMEKLRVVIEYDQNCVYSEEIQESFSSIAPYVNFAHKHDPKNDKVMQTKKANKGTFEYLPYFEDEEEEEK